MRRTVGALVIVFCSAMLLYGQEAGQGQGKEMTGWICSSKCVTQSAGAAACDENCTDKSGDVVFVSDSGKVTKIANPEIAQGKMGKKVKCHGKMMEDQNMVQMYDVVLANPPG